MMWRRIADIHAQNGRSFSYKSVINGCPQHQKLLKTFERKLKSEESSRVKKCCRWKRFYHLLSSFCWFSQFLRASKVSRNCRWTDRCLASVEHQLVSLLPHSTFSMFFLFKLDHTCLFIPPRFSTEYESTVQKALQAMCEICDRQWFNQDNYVNWVTRRNDQRPATLNSDNLSLVPL